MARYGEIWEDLAPWDAEFLLIETWGALGRYGEVWRDMGRSCAMGCGTLLQGLGLGLGLGFLGTKSRVRLGHQAAPHKERLLSDQAHKERGSVAFTGHQAGTRLQAGLSSAAV